MNSITGHHVYILTREKRERIHNLIFKEKKIKSSVSVRIFIIDPWT